MNSAFLIHIPSGNNTMVRKRAIRRSCWFQYYTKCPRESSSSRESSSKRAQAESSSSDNTDSMITLRALLWAHSF